VSVKPIDKNTRELIKKGLTRYSRIIDESNISAFTDPLLSEINYMNVAFREIVAELLNEISDFSELEAFESEVSERLAFIEY
jgi:hypothetical protein